MIRAFCYATGLIEFGTRVPKGALIIARGPEKQLRDYIETMARHGYRTRFVRGRRTKVPGSDTLLVPGVPEAVDQRAGLDALHQWMKWIDVHAPRGVRVLPR